MYEKLLISLKTGEKTVCQFSAIGEKATDNLFKIANLVLERQKGKIEFNESFIQIDCNDVMLISFRLIKLNPKPILRQRSESRGEDYKLPEECYFEWEEDIPFDKKKV